MCFPSLNFTSRKRWLLNKFNSQPLGYSSTAENTYCYARRCTSQRPSLAFPSQNRFFKLSHKEAPNGRRHTFVSDKSLTVLHNHLRFFHSLIDAPPSASITGNFLHFWRTLRHCHVPHKYLNERLRCCLYPSSVLSA